MQRLKVCSAKQCFSPLGCCRSSMLAGRHDFQKIYVHHDWLLIWSLSSFVCPVEIVCENTLLRSALYCSSGTALFTPLSVSQPKLQCLCLSSLSVSVSLSVCLLCVFGSNLCFIFVCFWSIRDCHLIRKVCRNPQTDFAEFIFLLICV